MLSKTRNPKHPDYRYFDTRQFAEAGYDAAVGNGEEGGPSHEAFVTAYGKYVLYRTRNFSSK